MELPVLLQVMQIIASSRVSSWTPIASTPPICATLLGHVFLIAWSAIWAGCTRRLAMTCGANCNIVASMLRALDALLERTRSSSM